jgi:hypothetical protein
MCPPGRASVDEGGTTWSFHDEPAWRPARERTDRFPRSGPQAAPLPQPISGAPERARAGRRRVPPSRTKTTLAMVFPLLQSDQRVCCSCPHSLQENATRTCPLAAETRFFAPHLPQVASMRVSTCLIVTDFRCTASLTRRSVSSRISCFDTITLFVFKGLISGWCAAGGG